MARRIQWGLALLVVLGFVAPGASHGSSAVAARPGIATTLRVAPADNTNHSDYAPIVVRQSVDLDDARGERGGGGLKRVLLGTAHASPSAAPSCVPALCRAHREVAHSAAVSSVTLRAPPVASA